MSGPYTIKWGIFGGPSWPETRAEDYLEDALQVAQANGGAIFDARGNQLTAEDIEAELHPHRKLAEEIVGSLMAGLGGQIGVGIEIHDYRGQRSGYWSTRSAIVAVERCLEGSGL